MTYKITQRLAEILGIPRNAQSATLHLDANKPPLLTVTTFVTNDKELATITDQFYLVLKDPERRAPE